MAGEIPSWLSKDLTSADLAKLEQLVAEIEKKTEGEIVPVLVRQSVFQKVWSWQGHPWVRWFFFSSSELQRAAEVRAELEFYKTRVAHTHKKTGVLLFLSFFERRAVVLADEGLRGRVPEAVWQEVVALLTSGAREHRLAEGLEKAIQRSGEILLEAFPQKDPDLNQLPNRLIIKS